MEAQDVHDAHGRQQEGVSREEAEPDLRAKLQLGGLCDVARDHEPHDEQGRHEEAEMDLRPSRRLCRRKALVLTQLSNSAVITSSIGKQAIQISSGSTFTYF